MSNRSASSNHVHFFRPSLEILEDRIVPSSLGDQIVNFGNGLANAAIGLAKVAAVNKDVFLFDLNPTPSNFISLLVDSLKLDQTVQALNVQVQAFTTFVQDAEDDDARVAQFLGSPVFFTPPTKDLVDGVVGKAQSTLAYLQDAVNDSFANVITAYFYFVGQSPANLTPLPAAPSSPPSTTKTGGGYGWTPYPAPSTASQSGPNITESAYVTASAGNDAPINVTITYSSTDGAGPYNKSQDLAPGQTAMVSLPVMPCSAGSTGTWTIYIDGQQVETDQTVFTQ